MKHNTLIKWTGIVTVLLVISRLTGFVREASIAYGFGATFQTDAYLVAAMLPQILFHAFSDAVKTAVVPVYGEYHKTEDGNTFALTLYFIIGLILFVLSALLVIFAPHVVSVAAPGFQGETYDLAVIMSRILLPGLFFMGLSGISSGILHTKKNFVTPAMVAYPSNLIVIFAAIFIGSRFGIIGLAWATIIGFSSQFLIQVPSVIKHGIFKTKKLSFRHPGVKKIFVLLPPVVLGGTALELKSIIDRVFGSLLPEGSISALNYAHKVYLLPNGIIILALITVLYPTMVDLGIQGNMTEFKKTLQRGLGLILLLVLPMMVGLITLRVPIVRLLFERGVFDVTATGRTAFALAFYSTGLIGIGFHALIYRSFYALKDTWTPMKVTFGIVGANIVFNWLLIKPLQHGGIALGTALAFNLSVFVLWYLLRKKIGHLGGRQLLQTFIKAVIASLFMGIVLIAGSRFLSDGHFVRQLLTLSVLISAGAAIYLIVAWMLKIEELELAVAVVRKKFLSSRHNNDIPQ